MLQEEEGFWLRSQIAIFIIFLAACSPVAARCSCGSLGGGASYNFLGDPAMDIGRDSYDEFVRDNIPAASLVDLPDVKMAAQSRMSLNLNDQTHMDLILSLASREFSGRGNKTQANETEQVEAVGLLQGNKLFLNVSAKSGVLYRFNLANEGSIVLGDYSQTKPNGEELSGVADGKWEI
jgi:hypothetical protein